jgi:hypothetical protein
MNFFDDLWSVWFLNARVEIGIVVYEVQSFTWKEQ